MKNYGKSLYRAYFFSMVMNRSGKSNANWFTNNIIKGIEHNQNANGSWKNTKVKENPVTGTGNIDRNEAPFGMIIRCAYTALILEECVRPITNTLDENPQ